MTHSTQQALTQIPLNKQGVVACDKCEFFGILGVLNELDEGIPFNYILKRQQLVSKGESLFREGQPFHAAYAVSSGTFMSYQLLDGDEQVLGFHLPGELFGLDAISAGHYGHTVRALEPSLICELHFDNVGLLHDHYPAFQNQLIQLMSGHIHHVQRQSLLAARQSSEERLAAFVLNIAERYAVRGFAATEFRLPMSRQAIASYLGLAIETVSRVFKRFQSQGLLTVSGKAVCLQDVGGLEALARTRAE